MASRRGNQRLEAVPALLIGSGLLVSSGVRRARRRRTLLEALQQSATASAPWQRSRERRGRVKPPQP